MENIQQIGVTAFIYYEDLVLILKRSEKDDKFPGYYELPGGTLEFGEDPVQGLDREIREETGLAVKILNPYWCFSHMFTDTGRQWIDIQYLAVILDDNPEVKLSPEHVEARWIGEDELGKITKISQEMKTAIQKGFEAVNK